MSKRFALIVFLFLVSPLARADNIVTVALNPVEFWPADQNSSWITRQFLDPEIVAATFTWDSTTGVLSNIVIAATGPFRASTANPTTLTGYQGPTIVYLQFALTSSLLGNAS